MNLLSFATPAFMAIGGYTVAIAGQYDITNAFLLTAGAFALPALVAVPLGALVLRLRGTYFVLVTFVLSQIMQLLLFETPGLTGGSNGIAGIPPVTLLGTELASNRQVLLFACGSGIAGDADHRGGDPRASASTSRRSRRTRSWPKASAWWCGATRRWASSCRRAWPGWPAIRW